MDDPDRSAHGAGAAGSPWSPQGPGPHPDAGRDPHAAHDPYAGHDPHAAHDPYAAHDPHAAHDPYAAHPGAARYPAGPVQPTAFGSPAYVEPGFAGEPQPPRRRSTIVTRAVIAGVCVLLIGLGGGYLVAVGLGSSNSAPTVNAGASLQQPAATAPGPASQGQGPQATPQPAEPAAPEPTAPSSPLGALGSLAGLAASGGTSSALGVVATIDGDDFTVRTLDGGESTVSTDGHTYFATVRGTGGIAKLAVGDLVFVGGTDGADGAIAADMVLGGAFPDLGPGTR